MRKNLPRGRLVVALDAPHSASITPRSAEPKPARIVHICPRAVSAAAVGVRIAAQGQGGIEDYCWRPGRALRASQPGSGRAGGPRAASQKALWMVPGRRAVPAVPTGSRLSSGRPAVTALVPLRNLLGHRALPAKISQGQRCRGDDEVCGLTGPQASRPRRKSVEGPWRKLRKHRPYGFGAQSRNGSRFAGISRQPAWRAPGRRARLGAAAARWAAPAPNGRTAGRPVVPLDRSGGRRGRA